LEKHLQLTFATLLIVQHRMMEAGIQNWLKMFGIGFSIPVDQQMSTLADVASEITTMANGLRITGEFSDCHQRLMQRKAEIIQRYWCRAGAKNADTRYPPPLPKLSSF